MPGRGMSRCGWRLPPSVVDELVPWWPTMAPGFQEADNERQRDRTGLGLTTMRERAEEMGAAPSGSARFRVRAPSSMDVPVAK